MNISPLWAGAITGYVASMGAAGNPPTTQKTRREHLQFLARRIDADPWAVTDAQLVEWAARQRWAPATRHSRRMTYQGFYRWAIEHGHTEHNPASALRKVRQSRPKPRPMPDRVYREALWRADEDVQDWLELARDHGLRRGEMATIHSRDLLEDLLGWSLRVHGKGGRVRVVPLTPRMARRLRDRVDRQGRGWLYPGDDNGHISPRWLGKRVNRILEDEWTMHSGRHSAGTRWNRTAGLLVARDLLGHASVATTEIYCAVDDDDLRRTVLATAS